MSIKILVLYGTARPNSNSEAYTHAFIEGIKETKQVEVTEINLAKKKLNGCLACYACKSKEGVFCVQNDGFVEIMNQMLIGMLFLVKSKIILIEQFAYGMIQHIQSNHL